MDNITKWVNQLTLAILAAIPADSEWVYLELSAPFSASTGTACIFTHDQGELNLTVPFTSSLIYEGLHLKEELADTKPVNGFILSLRPSGEYRLSLTSRS